MTQMCHGEPDEPDTFVGHVSPFVRLGVTRSMPHRLQPNIVRKQIGNGACEGANEEQKHHPSKLCLSSF
jgi:hypothetical protein